MKSFAITLTDRDWDDLVGGWRCPALRIPALEVGGLYSKGVKYDDSRYQVDIPNETVRFPGVDRPVEVALSLNLTKELSTSELTERWKKLAVLMPILTVLVGALIGRFVVPPPAPPSIAADECGSASSTATKPMLTPSCYETWRVTGKFKGASKFLRNLTTDVSPPKITIKGDGSFDEQIPVFNDGHGNRVFPSVIFDPNLSDYEKVSFHYDPKFSGGEGTLVRERTIDFGRSIEFKKVASETTQ